MKIRITLILTLLSTVLFAQQSYYNNVDLTLTGQALYNELQTKLSTYNTSFNYGDNRDTMKTTDDEDFNDADGNDTSTTLWLIYGYDDTGSCQTDRTRHEDDFGGSTCEYNREHVFARSLTNPQMGDVDNDDTGIRADPHNIRPADGQMNNNKSNKLFITGSGNAGTIGSINWYPGDEWKGDVARIVMYMYTRYGNQCLPEYTGTGPKQGATDMLQLFLQWNIEDPVSVFEAQRNDYLETVYGNRNPFIDNPYLATLIWGGNDAEDIWGTLSINTFTNEDFKLFPNPVSANQVTVTSSAQATLKLYNILGKLIFKKAINQGANRLQISTLSKGVYLMQFNSQNKTITKKLVIE